MEVHAVSHNFAAFRSSTLTTLTTLTTSCHGKLLLKAFSCPSISAHYLSNTQPDSYLYQSDNRPYRTLPTSFKQSDSQCLMTHTTCATSMARTSRVLTDHQVSAMGTRMMWLGVNTSKCFPSRVPVGNRWKLASFCTNSIADSSCSNEKTMAREGTYSPGYWEYDKYYKSSGSRR